MGDRQVFPVQTKRTVRMAGRPDRTRSDLRPPIADDHAGADTVPFASRTAAGRLKESPVEFAGFDEVWPALKARGVIETRGADGLACFALDAVRQPVRLWLGDSPRPKAKRPRGSAGDGDERVPCPPDRLAATLEAVLHHLHVHPVHVVPRTSWRAVFDVVSFGLAAHTRWQEIESQASVELNTRDPLVCAQGDLHTLRELVRVLLADGSEGDDAAAQGLVVIATGQPLVAKVEPHRPAELLLGGEPLSRQVREAAEHFLGSRSEAMP
jgi:hypothetical protein